MKYKPQIDDDPTQLDMFQFMELFWHQISESYGVKQTRERRNVQFRHAFMCALYNHTDLTQNRIGGIINVDHSTVIFAVKNHKNRLAQEIEYREIYNLIVSKLKKHISQSDKFMFKLPKGWHDLQELRIAYGKKMAENDTLKSQLAKAQSDRDAYFKQYQDWKVKYLQVQETVTELKKMV